MFPVLTNADVLGPQFPKTLASTAGFEGFWELQSNNTWLPKVGNHCSKSKIRSISATCCPKVVGCHLKRVEAAWACPVLLTKYGDGVYFDVGKADRRVRRGGQLTGLPT